jgi:Uma2 family endonuclease
MSVAEPPPALDRVLNDDRYEVIDGEIVEMPPMSVLANQIASRLLGLMWPHANAARLGQVVTETLFRLPLEHDRHRNRRPDVAFVSYDRWARGKPPAYRDNAWDVVPDLAIEVVSPTDFGDEIVEKVQEYFRAGVRAVWVVYPKPRVVHLYDSMAVIRGLSATDDLDGGTIIPGLRFPLAEVFADELADEGTNSAAGDS